MGFTHLKSESGERMQHINGGDALDVSRLNTLRRRGDVSVRLKVEVRRSDGCRVEGLIVIKLHKAGTTTDGVIRRNGKFAE